MRKLAPMIVAITVLQLPLGDAYADGMWSGGPIQTDTLNPLDRIPSAYRDLVSEAAEDTGFSLGLIDALIWAESGYDPNAVSKKGAQGLVQIMPDTAEDLELEDPFDPRSNLAAGLTYLRTQLDAFGSLPLALAAYNAGPSAVGRHKGIPPFPETHGYVAKILSRAGLLINPPRSRWRGAIGSAHPQTTGASSTSYVSSTAGGVS